MLAAAAEQLAASPLGTWATETALAYPVANTAHVLGLVMFLGAIGIVDLRLAGLWRTLPLPALGRALVPVAIGGFGVMAASGLVMFAADAEAMAASTTFRWKLALIGLALANLLVFRGVFRTLPDDPVPPFAQLLALLSLLLWTLAAVAGRWVAYS